jgi:hypothetical protein
MIAATVGIASLCGAPKIRCCLDALARQQDAPAFEVVVAHDQAEAGIEELRRGHPGVRFVSRPGARTPMELLSVAADEAAGAIVLLTEDHCVPSSNWVARLAGELRPGRAAVGGPILAPPGPSAVAWAFYFLDFSPYAGGMAQGPSPSLSVCNVAYRRSDLEAVRAVWTDGFHEMEVHRRLVSSRGPLWAVPEASVTMTRRVGWSGAAREAYGQGRLFAAKRVSHCSPAERWRFLLFTPALPAVLFVRRARRALASHQGSWGRLAALGALVFAWSSGEAMGYLTGRPPRRLTLAPDVS